MRSGCVGVGFEGSGSGIWGDWIWESGTWGIWDLGLGNTIQVGRWVAAVLWAAGRDQTFEKHTAGAAQRRTVREGIRWFRVTRGVKKHAKHGSPARWHVDKPLSMLARNKAAHAYCRRKVTGNVGRERVLQVQASMSVLGQWGALGQKRLLVSVGECWESVDECWGVLASAGGWPWRACLHQHQEGGGGVL